MVRAGVAFLLLALLLLAPPARADEEPAADGDDDSVPAATSLIVGVVTGDRVNVRVGPRIDNREVTHLAEGEVVLIVEEKGDWVAVRIPAGFPVAVSTDFTEAVGPDALRVKTSRLNLRVHPPEEGLPAPGIFQDHPPRGALLPLLESVDPRGPAEGASVRVVGLGVGPRARGDARFRPRSVRQAARPRGGARRSSSTRPARARRGDAVKRLAEARLEAAAREAGLRLMEVLGGVQQDLYRLRQAGGTDKAPIVALANRLDGVLGAESTAAESVLRLARALREDLEREIQLRVARHQAAIAKTRGLEPPAIEPLEPVVEDTAQVGEVRYEPTPGWTEEGVYFLFIGGRPRFTLRLTTGGPLPHPDFSEHVQAGAVKLVGRQPGDRLFGLPVFAGAVDRGRRVALRASAPPPGAAAAGPRAGSRACRRAGVEDLVQRVARVAQRGEDLRSGPARTTRRAARCLSFGASRSIRRSVWATSSNGERASGAGGGVGAGGGRPRGWTTAHGRVSGGAARGLTRVPRRGRRGSRAPRDPPPDAGPGRSGRGRTARCRTRRARGIPRRAAGRRPAKHGPGDARIASGSGARRLQSESSPFGRMRPGTGAPRPGCRRAATVASVRCKEDPAWQHSRQPQHSPT